MQTPSTLLAVERPAERLSNKPVVASLLDVLGVAEPARREVFEQLIARQSLRCVPAEQAEQAIARAFGYHSKFAEAALGIVQALHGGAAAGPGSPTEFDDSVLSLGLMNVSAWTDRLTCAPLRHAARLTLTPEQQELLRWIVEGDRDD